MRKLIPRLNYSYGFKDFLLSILSLFTSKCDMVFLNVLFETEEIYFVNHARTGLRLLLNSLSLPANSNIGVQVYNCHTVFNAIQQAGHHPVFIDIDTDFRIDINDLERKKKTIDALIVTHTFGIPADIEKVKRIFSEKPIIEDCAHAFLSRYNNRLVGKNGDAAIFSIGKGKFPSIGSGGIIVINNKKLIPVFLSNFSRLPQPGKIDEISNIIKNIVLNVLHNPYIYRYLTSTIIRNLNKKLDINGNFNHIENKILKTNLLLFCKKQSYFESYLKKQLNNLVELKNKLFQENISGIYIDPKVSVNGFMLPVLRENPDQIMNALRMNGVELGRHFSDSIKWAKQFGYSDGICPNAEIVVNKIITLPCHYSYPKQGIRMIIKYFK